MTPAKRPVKSAPNAPWCDTCHQRIVWREGQGWRHIDEADHWRPVTLDHEPTGKRWDLGERPPS